MTEPLVQIELFIAAAAAMVSAVGIVWTWITKRGQINRHDIDDLETRVTTLETKMEALPTHQDLTEIQGRITRVGDKVSREVGDVRSEVGEVKGAITAGNRVLDNILQALLSERNQQ
ncbi:MAG: DUF2730 family protein [Holophagales bacterium]|nr:DUF2730 family protein [Holophagales bacterium]MYB20835.1 DUF2730 family protein [Holophagales bacterium]MYD23459.1 DUF2730 family protein [Holophagales bacterium]MYH25474.1 DUF2730 family protein [Holophagales bacterium]MYI34474.1 DUF2730 family protein [Holophagales bacterium]